MSASTGEELEKELRKLYLEVPGPPAGLVAGRERMLAEAARTAAQTTHRPLSVMEPDGQDRCRRRHNMNLLAYKVLAVMLAVAVALGGAGGAATVAADSLPGDLLYAVKLISEDMRLLVTLDRGDRAQLLLGFVGERVAEMESVVNRGDLIPKGVVSRMTRQLDQVMVEIAGARPEEGPPLLKRVMDTARNHQQELERVCSTAPEGARAALDEACQAMERTRQAAGTALEDPTRFRNEYQMRHHGAQGPHYEAMPSPTRGPEGSQQEYQHRYEGNSGPHGEAPPCPTSEPQQVQHEYEHRYEDVPGPHGQVSPPPTETPTAIQTPGSTTPVSTGSEPERNRNEQEQSREGTPGTDNEEATSWYEGTGPTHGPEQNAQSKKGH